MIKSAVVACWDAINVRKTVHRKPGTMVFLALLFMSSSIQLAGAMETVQLTFNLSAEKFDTFIDSFVKLMREEVDGYTFSEGKHILPPEMVRTIEQRKESLPPNTLIKIEVIGEKGKSCSLYLRGDNLYLVAFATEAGQIYYMGDKQGDNGAIFPFPDAKKLNFDMDYRSIFASPDPQASIDVLLEEVIIGSSALKAQSSVLADYAPEKVSDVLLGKALLPFIIMFSEAMRIHPIQDKCKKHWDNAGFLTEAETKYRTVWGSGSSVWCTGEENSKQWDKVMKRDLQRRQIDKLKQLDDILFMVKRPAGSTERCSPAATSPAPANSSLVSARA